MMVSSLSARFSTIVRLIPLGSSSAESLYPIVKSTICDIEACGLFVKAVCIDNYPLNVRLSLETSRIFLFFVPTYSSHQNFFRLGIVNSIISFPRIWFRFIGTYIFRVRNDFVVDTIISSPPDGWQLYNILYFHLIFGYIYSTIALNMLSNFHTYTMKFFRLMAQMDLYLLVTSPFRRIGILTNPSLHDKTIECQIIFISDLLNISSQLLTLSIIITILTIYGH